jgi:Ca2+-binding RTX toxin-like protein
MGYVQVRGLGASGNIGNFVDIRLFDYDGGSGEWEVNLSLMLGSDGKSARLISRAVSEIYPYVDETYIDLRGENLRMRQDGTLLGTVTELRLGKPPGNLYGTIKDVRIDGREFFDAITYQVETGLGKAKFLSLITDGVNELRGTAGADRAMIDMTHAPFSRYAMGAGHDTIEINASNYEGEKADLNGVSLSGGAGFDTLTLWFNYSAKVNLQTKTIVVDGTTWQLGALSFEKVQLHGDFGYVTGTDKDEQLGTGRYDGSVYAGGGNDSLNGAGGNEWLFGGDGNDTLTAMMGDDSISGGDGIDTVSFIYSSGIPARPVFVNLAKGRTYGRFDQDTIEGVENVIGSRYRDIIRGDANANLLRGEMGDDSLYGGAGNDRINGGRQDDWLYGGEGDDHLIGGRGDDTLWGEAGNDHLVADHRNTVLLGGAGADQFEIRSQARYVYISDFEPGVDTLLLSRAFLGVHTQPDDIVETFDIGSNWQTILHFGQTSITFAQLVDSDALAASLLVI